MLRIELIEESGDSGWWRSELRLLRRRIGLSGNIGRFQCHDGTGLCNVVLVFLISKPVAFASNNAKGYKDGLVALSK